MNFDAHSVAALDSREELLQCTPPVLLRETPGQQAASKAAALMGATSALLRLQRVYEGGDHRALVEALAVCACNQTAAAVLGRERDMCCISAVRDGQA